MLALSILSACGGRTSLDAPITPDARATAAAHACNPGDPPATLTAGFVTQGFNALATDGVRLYVAQTSAPLLWSIDVSGTNRVDLDGRNFEGTLWGRLPLLASGGGLFFNSFGAATEQLNWVSGTGGPVKTVSATAASFFDAPRGRALAAAGAGFGPTTVDAISLADGTTRVFLTTRAADDLVDVVGTERFLHMIVVTTPSIQYTDRRIDLATGQLHDEIVFHTDNSQFTAGAGAVCAVASGGAGIRCIADGQDRETTLASGSAIERIPYVDADWVYATFRTGAGPLSRFALASGREQELIPEGAIAVTSFDECIYVATLPGNGQPSGAIMRLAPPE